MTIFLTPADEINPITATAIM